VNTLLVDPPAAPSSEQPTATHRDGAPPAGPADGEHRPPGRTCCNCDAPIGDEQQWCLQCGAAQPGSLAGRASWRPLSTLTLLAVLLAAGAAVAGAAALGSHKAAPRPVAVVTTPAPTTSVPGATTPTTPGVPSTPGAASTPLPKVPPVKAPTGGAGATNPLFPSTGKAPRIPAPAATPKPSAGSGAGSGSNQGAGTGASEKTSPGPGAEGQGNSTAPEQPSALLLDTDAASTYNPYTYPAAGFGDAALAIDGEAVTAWTAQVQPSSAPNMAEGLLLDLKSPTKLGAVTLATTTKGMTVQLYGAKGKQTPKTITEPGWVRLSATRVLKKRTTHIKLHGSPTLRWVLVWVVKAPASAVGSAQAPGHVNLNEVELFPPAGS
jgi:hypothetical protein